eukprot:5853619-Prymnesium_polylepis.1
MADARESLPVPPHLPLKTVNPQDVGAPPGVRQYQSRKDRAKCSRTALLLCSAMLAQCHLSLLSCARWPACSSTELGISDLPMFIAMLEDDLDDVLEKLRSDCCRAAASACPTMSGVDASTTTAACIRTDLQRACCATRVEGWKLAWQRQELASDSERMCRDARSQDEPWHPGTDV